MKKSKFSVALIVVLYYVVITIIALTITSCGIISRKTSYSCPNDTNRKGVLFQRLPQPPPAFKPNKVVRHRNY